jgi:hypothetical protein
MTIREKEKKRKTKNEIGMRKKQVIKENIKECKKE